MMDNGDRVRLKNATGGGVAVDIPLHDSEGDCAIPLKSAVLEMEGSDGAQIRVSLVGASIKRLAASSGGLNTISLVPGRIVGGQQRFIVEIQADSICGEILGMGRKHGG